MIKNKKLFDSPKIRNIKNAIFSILLVFGAFLVYVLTNGGDVMSFISDIRNASFTISLISAYLIFSTFTTSAMAFGQAVYDEDMANSKIKKLKTNNAVLNNSIDIKYANLFTTYYNDELYKQEQKNSNEQATRKLKAKLYKVSNVVKEESIKDKITLINNKLKKGKPIKKMAVFAFYF